MDGGDEKVWIERSKAQAAANEAAEVEFFSELDKHREKIGPCERCDEWMRMGLSPFCPPHEPTNHQ